ncbi:unnamed protein product [Brachionus calyciflorus]|uniref:Endonuclease/exonuclease/phosphatase domain-containing protein n=1 Tax=Brachionus calyciflorus TaxID=104777 RepID=A0A814Q9Q9_9BILA|nr:unnamed protein product [Brachionus calyciflorus]
MNEINNTIKLITSKNTAKYDKINNLDEFIHSLNLGEPLFITGDLNMDYSPSIKSNISEFIPNNDLVNFVQKPTRVCTKFYKKTNSTKCSSTLIDLFLHNGDLVDETDVFQYKSMNDFKNSKKFWEYYSSKIKVKSEKSNSNPISLVKNNGKSSEGKTDLCNIFNVFFTSISSSSKCSTSEASDFIEKEITVDSINGNHDFKFSFTTANEIDELYLQKYSNHHL